MYLPKEKYINNFRKGIARDHIATIRVGDACVCSAFLLITIFFIKIILYIIDINGIIKLNLNY